MYLFSTQKYNVIKINYELLAFISKRIKNRHVANRTEVTKTRLLYFFPYLSKLIYRYKTSIYL